MLVCSPHILKCAGIVAILEGAGYLVHSVVADAGSLLASARAETPSLILLDSALLPRAMSFIGELAERSPIAVLVGSDKSPLLREAMGAGARGFLSIDVDPAQFLESVNLLSEGAIVISQEPGRAMVDGTNCTRVEMGKQALTAQEKEIAVLVAKGASNREIGEALSISEHAVKAGLAQVLARLNLRNRQQLAAYAAQQGMLEDIATREQAPGA